MAPVGRPHTTHFARWLRANYQAKWSVADLVERGVGVHNGQMHRCLSQIHIRLFQHEKGFDSIISTSSIIEGVNTSAQNVVIWKSKLGSSNRKDFTYKNIIGRGGRMFKYFVGHIYLLDIPPTEEDAQLEISFPDGILGSLDEEKDKTSLTLKQIEEVINYRNKMANLIGSDNFARLKKNNSLQDNDGDFLFTLASNMKANPDDWAGFSFLNSNSPNQWERMLYKIIRLKPAGWDAQFKKIVVATKVLSKNWTLEIPELLRQLSPEEIGIEEFFQLERKITFRLAALLSDTNELHKILVNPSVDISGFIGRISHAFLPPAVYHLEEYGLPRMIARKIQVAGLIDFTNSEIDLRGALILFKSLGLDRFLRIETFTPFDRYVIKFFFDGITAEEGSNEVAAVRS
jgi:hypothetical protein